MNIIDKLELLKYADKYYITKREDGFEIEEKRGSLSAFVDNSGEIKYYRTGCYYSGSDWMDIDIKALKELEEFCNILKGE